MVSLETRMAAAIRLSEKLLEAGRQRQWEHFAALETQRGELLELLFSTVAKEQPPAELSRGIRRILSIDEQTLAICESVKKNCAAELAKFSKGRKAHHSYTQHQLSP